MKSEIFSIFPEPIYNTKLERNFSKDEVLFFQTQKNKVLKKEGNLTSFDNYILKNNQLNNLHTDLIKVVLEYFNKIIQSKNILKPYITQSWLNYTYKDGKHHSHKHPNSLVSGVLYISANKEFDSITFEKERKDQIHIDPSNFNIFNSPTWSFSIETYDILLFPSYLSHFVEFKKGDNERISLAFNVFIKGKIGNDVMLTELNL